MDDYRKSLIEFVRAQPLLWDPTHPDYKNKEQRNQVWGKIDCQLPTCADANARSTWDQLTRGFSNALKRKDKRSCSGAGSGKDWKFEKDMMFLLPAKQLRVLRMTGNLPFSFMDTNTSTDIHIEDSQDCDCDDDMPQNQTQPHPTQLITVTDSDEANNSTEEDEETTIVNEMPQTKNINKRKRQEEKYQDDTKTIIDMIKQRQKDRATETERLGFFRSLMPTIDGFTEDEFMTLQIKFIQAVQTVKNARRCTSPY